MKTEIYPDLAPAEAVKNYHIAEYRAAMQTIWDPTDQPKRTSSIDSLPVIKNLAINAIASFNNAEILKSDLEKANSLSQDKLTDSLTPKGYDLLVEELESNGIFDLLNNGDWKIQICLVDLDKLNQHNDLGGHVGGNEALEGFSSVLSGKLFRRNGAQSDNELPLGTAHPNTSEHIEHIKLAVQSKRTHDIPVRLGGDELAVITILPEGENDKRSQDLSKAEELENEKQRIENGLRNVHIEYYSEKNKVSDNAIRTDGLVINFVRIGNSTIRAQLTTTFAVTRLDTVSSEALDQSLKMLDGAIKQIKVNRTELTTRGVAI